jgi:hypothetical protein
MDIYNFIIREQIFMVDTVVDDFSSGKDRRTGLISDLHRAKRMKCAAKASISEEVEAVSGVAKKSLPTVLRDHKEKDLQAFFDAAEPYNERSGIISLNGLPSPSLKQLALIHGDAFIGGTEFDGGNVTSNALALRGYFAKIKDSGIISSPATDTISRSLDTIIESSRQMDKITYSGNMNNCAEFFKDKVLNLAPGKSFCIPGGWKGTPGHAMLYEFTKQPSGKYTVIIFNTGGGIDTFHDSVSLNYKKRYKSEVVFKNVPPQEIFFNEGTEGAKADMFLALLQRQKSIGYRNNYDNAECIYKGVFGHLAKYCATDSDTYAIDKFITGQRSGTCSWKVLTAALMRRHLSRDEYKRAMLFVKMYSLKNFYHKNKTLLAEDTVKGAQGRAIVTRAAKTLERSMAKLFKLGERKEVIKYEEVKAFHNFAVHVLREVKGYEDTIQEKRSHEHKSLKVERETVDMPPLRRRALIWAFAGVIKTSAGFDKVKRTGLPETLRGVTAESVHADFIGMCTKVNALDKADRKAAAAAIEQFVEKLKVPTAQEGDFWDTVERPQDLLASVECLLESYHNLTRTASLPMFPQHVNTACTLYSVMDVLATRIDKEWWAKRDRSGGKVATPLLEQFSAFCPVEHIIRNSYLIFFDEKNFDRREEVIRYFQKKKSGGAGDIFNFKGVSTNSFSKSVLESTRDEDRFYLRLLNDVFIKDDPGFVERCKVYNRTFGWSQFSEVPDKVLAFVEIFKAYKKDDKIGGLFKEKGLEHILSLKRAARLATAFTLDDSEYKHGADFSKIYTAGNDAKDKVICILEQFRDQAIWNFYYTGKVYGSMSYGRDVHPCLSRSVYNILDDKFMGPSSKKVDYTPKEEHVLDEKVIRRAAVADGAFGDTFSAFVQKVIVRTQCERDLQPYQLLSFFRENVHLLEHVEYQELFDILFFRSVNNGKSVVDKDFSLELDIRDAFLKREDFVRQCTEFVRLGISVFHDLQPGQRPKVPAAMFFVRCAQHISHFIGEDEKEWVENLQGEVRDFVTTTLQREDVSHEEIYLLHLHRLFGYVKNDITKLGDAAIQECLESWNMVQMFKGAKEVRQPALENMCQSFMYNFLRNLKGDEGAHAAAISGAGHAIVRAFKHTHDKTEMWETGGFPVISYSDEEGKLWEVNLATGEVVYDKNVCSTEFDQDRWEGSSIYKRVFGGKEFSYKKIGSKACFYDENNGNMRVSSGGRNWILEREIEGEGWCQYVAPSQFTACFPYSIISWHNHWVPLKESNKVIVSRRDDGSTVAEMRDGTAFDIKTDREITSLELEHEEVLQRFERPEYIRCEWEKKEDEDDKTLERITFPRYKKFRRDATKEVKNGKALAFTRNKEGLLAWDSDKRYVLASEKPEGLVGGFNNMLLLSNTSDARKQKILVPFQCFREMKDLTDRGELDVIDKKRQKEESWSIGTAGEFEASHEKEYRYFEIEMCDGNLSSMQVEGNLFLAYIMLQQKKYSEALHFIRKSVSGRDLSIASQEIIRDIMRLPEAAHDMSASSVAVALHASLLQIKNHESKPPSQKDKDEDTKFTTEKAKEFKGNPEGLYDALLRDRAPRTKSILMPEGFKGLYKEYLHRITGVENCVEMTKEEEKTILGCCGNDEVIEKRRQDLGVEPASAERREKTVFSPSLDSYVDDPSFREYGFTVPGLHYGSPSSDLTLEKVLRVSMTSLNSKDFFWSAYETISKGSTQEKRRLKFLLQEQYFNNPNKVLTASEITALWRMLEYDLSFSSSYSVTWPGNLKVFRDEEERIRLERIRREGKEGYYYYSGNEAERKWRDAVRNKMKRSRVSPSRRGKHIIPGGAILAHNALQANIKAPLASLSEDAPLTPVGFSAAVDQKFNDFYVFCSEAQTCFSATNTKYEGLPEMCSESDIDMVCKALGEGEKRYEAAVREEMKDFHRMYEKGKKKVETQPRYSLSGKSEEEKRGDVIQLDLHLKCWEDKMSLEEGALKKDILFYANRRTYRDVEDTCKALERQGSSQKTISMEDLQFFFLQGKEEFFTRANKELQTGEVQELYDMIGEYLYVVTQRQQVQRCLKKM